MALTYFSLGPDAEKNAQASLGSYYAYMGEESSAMIVANAVKDADSVKAVVSSFESKGCDELILFPSSPDPEQVTLLADAAGL